MKSTATNIEILLVEDNEADVELTRQGLRDARILNNLHVVRSGPTALDFVYRRGAYEDAPRPDLILLDINLPGMSGSEVLRTIKSDPETCEIPVVVLTTSADEADVSQAYGLHANSFVTKPVRFGDFVEAVREISEYWFALVRLPPTKPS